MSDRTSRSTVLAEWSQVVSAMVGAVAAIVAGVVGWLTLQQGQLQDEQGKTQQTLQFFATFNAPSMLTTREALGNEDWCARYGYMIKPDYEPEVSTAQLVSVIDFFDAVHNSCTKQDLCNAQFADELFSPYAVDYYDQLSRTIVDRRGERGDNFGIGIAMLSHQENTPVEQIAERYREQSCGPISPAATPTPQ